MHNASSHCLVGLVGEWLELVGCPVVVFGQLDLCNISLGAAERCICEIFLLGIQCNWGILFFFRIKWHVISVLPC